MEFLKVYLENYLQVDLEVIGFVFECYEDLEKVMVAIWCFKDYFNLGYEIVFVGLVDKLVVVVVLLMFFEVIVYFMMIIINKNGEVECIYIGFNGFVIFVYVDFRKEFNIFIVSLLE